MCKLLKSLYGLKQAPKQWHDKFNSALLDYGFSYSEADKCVYTKTKNSDNVIICLYVDDMLVFGICINRVLRIKTFLTSKFDLRDLGEASVILGVRIIRKGDSILLSQRNYVEKLLKKFGYYDLNPVSTPYDVKSHLKKNKGNFIDQT